MQAPKFIFEPHVVGAGFASISLIYAEKIRHLKSQEPVPIKILLGCQSIANTVELICFLMCLLTHQSFSFSK